MLNGFCEHMHAELGGLSADQACQVACVELCSPKGCDKSCEGKCTAINIGCEQVDCKAGFACHELCVDCADGVADCTSGCFPQCLPIDPDTDGCDGGADCKAGYYCEITMTNL